MLRRQPRERGYVRNGAVVDLQIERGGMKALVSGTDLYEIPFLKERLAWNYIVACAFLAGAAYFAFAFKTSGGAA